MNVSSTRPISSKKCGRPQDNSVARGNKIATFFFVTVLVISLTGCGVPFEKTQPTQSLPEGWVEKVSRIVWVAYSPSSSNPNIGPQATPDEIIADLVVLRDAGFNGLVTYGSAGNMGRELPAL